MISISSSRLENINIKKALLLFGLLVSFIFLFSALSSSFSPPANAANTCVSGSKNACFNATVNWSGKNGAGGGLGGGKPTKPGVGSGNTTQTSKPKPIPCARAGADSPYFDSNSGTEDFASTNLTNTSTCHPIYSVDVGWVDGEDASCPPIRENGFTVKSVGKFVSFTAPLRFIYDIQYWYFVQVWGDYKETCTYPKSTVSAVAKECALSANINVVRLANSAGGYKKLGLTPSSKTFATMGELTKGNGKVKCVQSASMDFSSNINAKDTKNWGQYQLKGIIKYAVCNEITLKFDGKTTYNYSCVGPKTGDAVISNLSIWCGGVEPGLVQKKWTTEDCVGTKIGLNKVSTICTPPKATFENKTGTVQTIRDGKFRAINWGNYVVNSNVRGVNNWRYKNSVISGSSPWNTEVSTNDKKEQYFTSKQKFLTWTKLQSGGTKQNIAFYQASNPGKSFSVKRTQMFDAEFRVKISTIESFNPWTGKTKTSTKTLWVKDKNIACPSQTSPKIQPIRTIGDAR